MQTPKHTYKNYQHLILLWLPVVIYLAYAFFLTGQIKTLNIQHQFNDALVFLAGAFRWEKGQLLGVNYTTPIGHLGQAIPAIILSVANDARLAFLGSNIFFGFLAILIIQRATHLGLPLLLQWCAIALILFISLTPASFMSTGNIAMYYNRWSLAIFGASLVWLNSLLHTKYKPNLLDSFILGAIFVLLFFIKVTTAAAFGLYSILFICQKKFHWKDLSISAVFFTLLLAMIEIISGGTITGYISYLLLLSPDRAIIFGRGIRKLILNNATEIYLFIWYAAGIFIYIGKPSKALLTTVIATAATLLLSILVVSQNTAHFFCFFLPAFSALGLTYSINSYDTRYRLRSVVSILLLVSITAPIVIFSLSQAYTGFRNAVSFKPYKYIYELSELNKRLKGIAVTTTDPPSTPIIKKMAALSTAPLKDFLSGLDGLGRESERPATIAEEFLLLKQAKLAIKEHCQAGARVSAIAWVDFTPLLLGDDYSPGNAYQFMSWNSNINSKTAQPEWLVDNSDCILLPKIYFNRYDHLLANYFHPILEDKFTSKKENSMWYIFTNLSELDAGAKGRIFSQ